MALGIDAQVAHLQHFFGCFACRVPPQDRLHPRHQLASVERFGHVVVGAELEADNLVHVVTARGEHDDRQVALLAQTAADLPAVDLGHHQVEHQQVGFRDAHLFERFATVARRFNREALGLQVHARELEDVLFVVCDEDGGH